MWYEPVRLAFLSAFLGASVGLVGPVRAQEGPAACARASSRLEGTERVISRASEMADRSGDATAASELRGARDLQTQARSEYEAGRCRVAFDLSRRAQDQALRVLQTVRQAGGGGDVQGSFVQQQLERTDELLERVTDCVRVSGDERSQRQLDDANALQSQARARYREASAGGPGAGKLLLRALDATLKARKVGQGACELSSQNRMNPDRVAEELRHTDEMIATATEFNETAQGSGSMALVNSARDLEERARRSYDQRDFQESLRLTLHAREILNDVLVGPVRVDPADVDRELGQAEETLNQARTAKLTDPGKRLLDQAELRFARAQVQRDRGRPRLALLSAQMAHSLAQRALTAPAR